MSSTFDPLSLFMTHRRRLIDYANGILGSRAQAEDVVQEAFLRFAPDNAGGAGAGGVGVEQPVAYLYRLVRNLAIDWSRRHRMETRHQEAGEIAWLVPQDSPDPEADLLQREELRRVAAALDALGDEARIALEMHRVGGYTLQEIAERLGMSVSSAHRLVHRAAIQVAQSLGPEDDDA